MKQHTLSECVDREVNAHHPDGYMYDASTKRAVYFDVDNEGIWRPRVVSPIDFGFLPRDGWTHERGCRCRDCRS